MSTEEWPPVLLGRVQRFGDVEYFDVPEDDADEYETQRYVPDTVLEELQRQVVVERNKAERNEALLAANEPQRVKAREYNAGKVEACLRVESLITAALQQRGG